MTKEQIEVQKVIRREKPIAKRVKLNDGYKYYADTSLGVVAFTIPFKEMGNTPFCEEMPSQLLIRWIQY